jgi:hypothetical protein
VCKGIGRPDPIRPSVAFFFWGALIIMHAHECTETKRSQEGVKIAVTDAEAKQQHESGASLFSLFCVCGLACAPHFVLHNTYTYTHTYIHPHDPITNPSFLIQQPPNTKHPPKTTGAISSALDLDAKCEQIIAQLPAPTSLAGAVVCVLLGLVLTTTLPACTRSESVNPPPIKSPRPTETQI